MQRKHQKEQKKIWCNFVSDMMVLGVIGYFYQIGAAVATVQGSAKGKETQLSLMGSSLMQLLDAGSGCECGIPIYGWFRCLLA